MSKRVLLLTLMIIIFSTIFVFANAPGLDKIDAAGNNILMIVRRIGYWVIAIGAIGHVVQTASQGDLHGAGKWAITYILIYASLFAIPFFMHLVEGIF